MIYEFAIEPAALDNWKNFKHFTGMFGIEFGRVISDFPKKWCEMVKSAYKGSASFKQVEFLKLIEELRSEAMKRKLVRCGRTYQNQLTWIDNALRSHSEHPFKGIIVKEECSDCDEAWTTEALWKNDTSLKVPTGDQVPRSETDLAEYLAPLLRMSNDILLIDTHFDPGRPKWLRSLEAIVERFFDVRSRPRRLELHVKCFEQANEEAVLDYWEQNRVMLSGCIPSELVLEVFLWREREGGEEFHDRFILTEKGGVFIGRGIDPDDSGNEGKHFNVQILSETLHGKHWTNYQRTTAAFDLVGGNPIRVIGTKRRYS